MAKKRKARRDPADAPALKSSKYNVEETFDDSADEFYAAKDKVLLDEAPGAARRRRLEEQEAELQPSDEDMLPYEDTDAEDFDEQDEDEEDARGTPTRRSAHDRSSDEESGSEADEDDEQNWGPNRSDYYDADVIETEADALEEEAEAKRLVQKQLKGMTDADFGLDEALWKNDMEEVNDGSKSTVVEKLPEARVPDNATEAEKRSILEARYPEFSPLSDDFIRLQKVKLDLDTKFAATQKQLKLGKVTGPGLSISTKRNALSAYLGILAMYFAVVSSSASKDSKDPGSITALPPSELREHPIIQQLTRAKQLWDSVQDHDMADLLTTATERNNTTSQTNSQPAQPTTKSKPIKTNKQKPPKPIEPESDDEMLPDAFLDSIVLPSSTSKPKKSKKEKSKQLDVQALLEQTANASSDSENDLQADEQPLDALEAAEKAKRKKSLRFYSSQIAQKANKRGAKAREAGGDDDVPRKERLRDKQERLLQEAERRGKKGARNDEELGGSDDDNDEAGGRTNKELQADVDDEYYDLLTATKSQKRADKEARANAYAEAAASNAQVFEEETIGPDGKRKITYAISKNKGLMPKRKKEVGNPRVKKRMKFDEKMKKLGSVRQVWKGGEGRGGYGGETTGIKSNLVKSVKLS